MLTLDKHHANHIIQIPYYLHPATPTTHPGITLPHKLWTPEWFKIWKLLITFSSYSTRFSKAHAIFLPINNQRQKDPTNALAPL